MMWASLRRDTVGAAAVITALALSAIVGFAALGSEVAIWYLDKRTMQGAADGAAFSAATAIAAGVTGSALLQAQAKGVASSYGFTAGSNSVTVTVNNPPTSGSYTGNSNAVEVIIQKTQGVLLQSKYTPSSLTLYARAVALAGVTGNGCVVTLNTGNVTDITNSGNTLLNLNACSLYINSPNSSALTLSGGAKINAQSAYIAGNYTTSGLAQLNTTSGTYTGTTPINDPYGNANMPAVPSACDQTNYSQTGGSQTITPTGGTYHFCGGFSLSGGSTLTLGAGTYFVDGGTFSVSGNSTVNASGATFVLTGSGSNYARVQITGGSTINVTAPAAGATTGIPGIAFFQDRNAPAGSDSFSGGVTQNITGAIYMSKDSVSFSGGSQIGGASCTQLIAYTATFSGNTASTFNQNCSGVGTVNIGSTTTKLVE